MREETGGGDRPLNDSVASSSGRGNSSTIGLGILPREDFGGTGISRAEVRESSPCQGSRERTESSAPGRATASKGASMSASLRATSSAPPRTSLPVLFQEL